MHTASGYMTASQKWNTCCIVPFMQGTKKAKIIHSDLGQVSLGGLSLGVSKKESAGMLNISWSGWELDRHCSIAKPCPSLSPHGPQHSGLCCLSLSPGVYSNSCPLSRWCYPFHPLLPSSPLTFNVSDHQGLFQWVGCLHQVAKVLELQLQHQCFQWTFRVDFL